MRASLKSLFLAGCLLFSNISFAQEINPAIIEKLNPYLCPAHSGQDLISELIASGFKPLFLWVDSVNHNGNFYVVSAPTPNGSLIIHFQQKFSDDNKNILYTCVQDYGIMPDLTKLQNSTPEKNDGQL
jgi:hypothetical protein